MLTSDDLLRLLDVSLSEVIPSEPVEVTGEWSTRTRKTYQSAEQLGSGSGPPAEVEDRIWSGVLSCPTPVSGMALLITPTHVEWAKAPTAGLTLPVHVSLSAYADYRRERSTFHAGMGGAGFGGLAIAAPAGIDGVCPPGPVRFTTGRTVTLARVEGIAFAVIVLPRTVLTMGRKHVWRLRENVAGALPPDIRTLLTRGRNGVLDRA
jgi:hypothetical protein